MWITKHRDNNSLAQHRVLGFLKLQYWSLQTNIIVNPQSSGLFFNSMVGHSKVLLNDKFEQCLNWFHKLCETNTSLLHSSTSPGGKKKHLLGSILSQVARNEHMYIHIIWSVAQNERHSNHYQLPERAALIDRMGSMFDIQTKLETL